MTHDGLHALVHGVAIAALELLLEREYYTAECDPQEYADMILEQTQGDADESPIESPYARIRAVIHDRQETDHE